MDDHYEQWMKETHGNQYDSIYDLGDSKGTDAILCCPCCFTTVCYQCKLK